MNLHQGIGIGISMNLHQGIGIGIRVSVEHYGHHPETVQKSTWHYPGTVLTASRQSKWSKW